MKKISVIIPVFQAGKWLPRTIDSCIEQEEFVKEIIIIDDFSTDDSWKQAQDFQLKYPALLKIYRNTSKGANNARNYGLTLATGEYIQWLDADDIILPGKLKSQLNFLEEHKDIDIVYSDWQLDIYNEKEELDKIEYKKGQAYNDYTEELLKDNWIPPHCYLVRRKINEKEPFGQGWNPDTIIGQDREYFTNYAINGTRFGYLAGNFCIYYRRHSLKSVSRSLQMKARAEHLMKMLDTFIAKIYEQEYIGQVNKDKYRNIILTQKLYYSAQYGLPASLDGFKLADTQWGLIKGMRSKIRMLKKIITG